MEHYTSKILSDSEQCYEQYKCYNNQCNNNREECYDLCRDCIQQFIRICTCNKTFITGKPTHYVLGKIKSDNGVGVITLLELPDPIPDFFYTQIKGNLYHILGCRGCQHTEVISVEKNYIAALQASIQSCVYQKVNDNGNIFYEYLSDSLDPVFEEYIQKHGIKVGEPAKIIIGAEDHGNTDPSIEIPTL